MTFPDLPPNTVDRALADSDIFADWLAGECAGAKRSYVFGVPRDAVGCQMMVDRAAVPQLVAFLLYDSDPMRIAAVGELKRRYLAEQQRFYADKESPDEL